MTTAFDYLNKIINWKVDLRTDLQCYARLLHLIAHYELGNFDMLEYLIKSVYRFMAKMENLSLVEEEIFKFLRKSFHLCHRKLKPEFEKLLEKLKSSKRIVSRPGLFFTSILFRGSKAKCTKSLFKLLSKKKIINCYRGAISVVTLFFLIPALVFMASSLRRNHFIRISMGTFGLHS